MRSIPGITALATDRATIEISNRTGDTVYYQASGWEPARLETCEALVEVEVQRGPLAPGATERVMLDAGWQQAGVPVTVAFWEAPCGEACAREPVGSVIVELSPIEPPAS